MVDQQPKKERKTIKGDRGGIDQGHSDSFNISLKDSSMRSG